jgi:hypothetical protein
MNIQQIKNDLTLEQVDIILKDLGSTEARSDNQGNLIYQTVCHDGDSHKLYYYHENKMFHCYTECGDSFDIFELVKRNRGCTFVEAINYVCRLLGITEKREGFISNDIIKDWDLINRYVKINPSSTEQVNMPTFNSNILNLFKDYYHITWLNDNISYDAMDKFNIKYDIIRNKIIIPHFNAHGQLIGIRGRALNQEEVDAGKKYMPIYIEGVEYNHPLGYNLYGLYENYSAIKKIKKIIIFESEKSVLQCYNYYKDNCFAVAVCGSNITNFQRHLILSLGVEEVFIAFDKEFMEKDSDEAMRYSEKIKGLANKFSPYVRTYVLWDDVDLLPYKSSPSDMGAETLEKLMANKYEITTQMEE